VKKGFVGIDAVLKKKKEGRKQLGGQNKKRWELGGGKERAASR